MALFRESREKVQRLNAVWALAMKCREKSFEDLCRSGGDSAVMDLWTARPTGPWKLSFLETNLAALAQLTAKKKLKLRTYGSLFEVGSSAFFRNENDSFEILAGDVLGVLYQASLQIYRPADSLVLDSFAKQIHLRVYAEANRLRQAKGPQMVQILKEQLRHLDADPKTYLHSRQGLRLRRDVALSLSSLVCNARQGLERLRSAYASKPDHRELVDVCVSVAKKVETQELFQFMELECVVDKALSIAAIRKIGDHSRGLVGSPKTEMGGKEGLYPVRDLQAQGDGLTVELKKVYVEKKPLLKQAASKQSASKQAAPARIEPVWEGDMSDWQTRQRLNQAKFRKICGAPILKMARASSRLISEEKQTKRVRFADAHSRPLVFALSVNTTPENATLDKNIIAAGARHFDQVGHVQKMKYPDGQGWFKDYDVFDRSHRPRQSGSDHEARIVAAELMREVKAEYCKSPAEEEVFDEVAESLIGEGSLDGEGSDQGS